MAGVDRRSVLTGGAAAAAWAFFSEGASAEPFKPDNVLYWFDEDEASHKAKAAKAKLDGYRTLSLSIHGDPAAPRFAAVMVKRPNPIDTQQFDNQSAKQIGQLLKDMPTGADPWYPAILSATGVGDQARYALVFTKLPTKAAPAMTRDQFAAVNDAAHKNNQALWWADAYGDAADPRYTGVWVTDPVFNGWSALSTADAAAHNTTLEAQEETAAVQARFDVLARTGVRPLRVSPTPGGGHAMIFTDTVVGPWECWGDMTLDQLKDKAKQQEALGRYPFQISATGVGAATRYDATWTSRDDFALKGFTANATSPQPLIEQAVQTFMADHALSGFQLAILKGAQLVYAGGFTWAEPGYPAITLDTRFRQGSVSKLLAAAAVWKLIEQGKLALDHTLDQALTGLKLPAGTSLANFSQITIKHLLESCSALPQGQIFPAVAPPFSAEQMVATAAATGLSGTPGDAAKVAYGNFDYFLLSQVVRAKTDPAASFEEALQTLVLAPLGMVRTGEAASLQDDLDPHEPPYHLRVFDPTSPAWNLEPFDVVPSARSADQPLVPLQYGGIDLEVVDGCGGLSASVLDLARLASIFTAQDSNPFLKGDTVRDWLKEAAKAMGVYGGNGAYHGCHGFDRPEDLGGGKYKVGKGGWLPGAEALVSCATGEWTFVAAKNGNSRPGATTDWLGPISLVAALTPWPNADLFPTFMNAAPQPAPSMLVKPAKTKPQVARDTTALVRASMQRDFGRMIARRKAMRVRLKPVKRFGGAGTPLGRGGRPPRPR